MLMARFLPSQSLAQELYSVTLMLLSRGIAELVEIDDLFCLVVYFRKLNRYFKKLNV